MKKIILILLIFISFNVFAQQLAFPTAVGDGAYTTGGRGGTVVHVTNLNDSGTGSLREAMSMTVPRIIVFDVSGVINLNSILGLTAANGDVTIAGQTAPDGGITIASNRGYFDGVSNIICRYIRFKGGKDISNDALSVVGNTEDHIFDHCTFGYGTDESASWYDSSSDTSMNRRRITVQKCLFNENSKGSIVGRLEGVGGTSVSATYYNNLFYNSNYRFPNVSVGTNGGQFDLINNVVWPIGSRGVRGNGAYDLNHIGNYYDYGTNGIRDYATNLHYYTTVPQIYNNNNKITGQAPSTPLAFTPAEMTADSNKFWGYFQDTDEVTAGNFVTSEDYEIKTVGTTDFTTIGASSNTVGVIFTATGAGSGTGTAWDKYYGDRLDAECFTDTQHNILGVQPNILTPDNALASVLTSVGCDARLNADGSVSDNKDLHDAESLNYVSTGQYIARISKTEYDVDPITSVTRPANFYVSNDHIPEAYFTVKGITGTSTIHNEVQASGYTLLEEYLNQVDSDTKTEAPVTTAPYKKYKILIISN